MNDSTFDVTKNYKKICYRADRDLLNTELNEMQDIEGNDRRVLLDKIFPQGSILSGLAGNVAGDNVTIADGTIYLEGCAVMVPGALLSFATPGEHLIYVDVFRREVTATEDPTLVNPLTGEPTAEREKWIATLQGRDTSGDPLPEGAISRSVVPVYVFNRDTGELRPYVGYGTGGDIVSAFANHAGHGGLDRHPAVTQDTAGFMTPGHLAQLADHESRVSAAEGDIDGLQATDVAHGSRITAVEAALPGKADDADVTALVNALNTHKTSADHDGRYYTETESDGRFAPVAHVGAGGTAHSAATTAQAGFMGAADKLQLGDHESRIDVIESTLPSKADDADVTAVTEALNTHKSSGDHDPRYYTKTQMDTALAGKADDADVSAVSSALDTHKTSADHDGRYFTETESDNRFAAKTHVGAGGVSQHPAATGSTAGFMSSADKTQLGDHESRIVSIETALPGKADDADVTAVTNALNTHKTSSDHDGRYFTETESDARFAPIAHVGAVGSAHGLATASQAGFLAKEVSQFLYGLIKWTGSYDYNGGSGALGYGAISGADGMVWRGRCDSNSSHRIYGMLRATGSPVTALFEIYHMVGTVTMETGSRVTLADPANHPSTIPGSKIYYVQLYPDSFTAFSILVSGSGEVGFSLNIFPGDDRQICYELDPNRAGKPIS